MADHRIYELDLLRFCAILMIMLYHIHGNVPVEYLYNPFFHNFGDWGLLLFFFLFGFFLYKYPCDSITELKRYLRSKFIRLIPIYWIVGLGFSWFIYVFLGFQAGLYTDTPRYVDSSLKTFLLQMIGSQFLQTIPSYPGMWFMGVLIFYLIIYAFTAFVTKEKFYTIFLLFLGIIPLNILSSEKIIIGVASTYYMPFIAGILAGYAYSAMQVSKSMKSIPAFISYCNYASYPVFLIHGKIYIVFSAFLGSLGIVSNDIIIMVFGFPLVFFIGYLIQKGYDKVIFQVIPEHKATNKCLKSLD